MPGGKGEGSQRHLVGRARMADQAPDHRQPGSGGPAQGGIRVRPPDCARGARRLLPGAARGARGPCGGRRACARRTTAARSRGARRGRGSPSLRPHPSGLRRRVGRGGRAGGNRAGRRASPSRGRRLSPGRARPARAAAAGRRLRIAGRRARPRRRSWPRAGAPRPRGGRGPDWCRSRCVTSRSPWASSGEGEPRPSGRCRGSCRFCPTRPRSR